MTQQRWHKENSPAEAKQGEAMGVRGAALGTEEKQEKEAMTPLGPMALG